MLTLSQRILHGESPKPCVLGLLINLMIFGWNSGFNILGYCVLITSRAVVYFVYDARILFQGP